MDYQIDGDESVSTAVERAVSVLTDSHPDDRADLDGVINAVALDELFAPREEGTARRGGELSFVYNGCRVTVNNGEYLTVYPLNTRLRTDGDN